MKTFSWILMLVGLTFSSCSKEEQIKPSLSVPSSVLDRDGGGGDPTVVQIFDGPDSQNLTCKWDDGYGTAVSCEGDHCALSSYSSGGNTYTGITCFDGSTPLHTDNYR